jgi:RNA polymerase sigma factor (sigma-70 family)
LENNRASKAANPALCMDLMTMLDILSEKDRAMLILKHAESYSYDELAEIFDLSVSGCKMRVSRARKQIQQAFPHNFS